MQFAPLRQDSQRGMDLEAQGVLTTALKECSHGGEVIVTITDSVHNRWALNLQHNLHSLGLPYALVRACRQTLAEL